MSKVLKGFKFRIYPTKEQKEFLSRQFGASRYVYNFFLARRKDEYLNNKKSLNYYDDCKFLTELKTKDGYEWLNDNVAQTLQASLRNLEVAYQNFFKKKARFPKFHSKNNRQNIKFPQSFGVVQNKLRIPKCKSLIKINLHQELPSKQICLFISKNPSNQYFATFLCEVEAEELSKSNNMIGIDLGLKDFLVTSNEEKFTNQKFFQKLEKKLIYQQRKLSRKKKNSKNKEKQRKILAKIHQKIVNQRSNFLHQISHLLINENQVIIAEDLNVKEMMHNKLLAKSIGAVGWGKLLRQLEYKSTWYGRTFHQIDRFFPSSKTCNKCQFVLDFLPLHVREWQCPNCQNCNDRDLNAACNIRDKGLKDLGLWNVILQKPAEAPSLDGSVKQEIF